MPDRDKPKLPVYIWIILGLQTLLLLLVFIFLMPTKEIERTPTLKQEIALREVRQISQLVSVEYNDFMIYKWEDTKDLDIPVLKEYIKSQKTALVIVKMKVLIGFDLQNENFSVKLDDKVKKIFITLPKPKILSIDPQIEIYNPENGWFNRFNISEDTNNIYKQAREKASNQALNKEYEQKAINSAKSFLESIFKIYDYSTEIEIKND
ncbi:MAG: DUF4230 domain-containing protein [Candidatus Coatesbacteria bacterium]|nr:DUF4230 domain-containing protein [Candidatus Coatesbacteria bacterium]